MFDKKGDVESQTYLLKTGLPRFVKSLLNRRLVLDPFRLDFFFKKGDRLSVSFSRSNRSPSHIQYRALRGEARLVVRDFFLLAIDVVLEFVSEDTKELAAMLSVMSVHSQAFYKPPKDATSSKTIKEAKEV